MVFIRVNLDQIDKMAPRRVKSAPVAIELNQHFEAETDLLDLECISDLTFFLVIWSGNDNIDRFITQTNSNITSSLRSIKWPEVDGNISVIL